MNQYTLIYRDVTTGLTGHAQVTGNDLAEASLFFECSPAVGDIELVGAFDGHITPLWWEE